MIAKVLVGLFACLLVQDSTLLIYLLLLIITSSSITRTYPLTPPCTYYFREETFAGETFASSRIFGKVAKVYSRENLKRLIRESLLSRRNSKRVIR